MIIFLNFGDILENLADQRKFIILLAFDKKAFYVRTDDRKIFPEKPGIISLRQRYLLKFNQKVYAFLGKFQKYSGTDRCNF